MKISKHAIRDARQLFRSCLVNGLLDESRVREAVTLLVARKPRGYAPILARLHRLVKLDQAQHAGVVESAVVLPPELQAEVVGRIGTLYGEGIRLVFREKPELLGGLRVKVGSDLYDGSIRTRLDRLGQSF